MNTVHLHVIFVDVNDVALQVILELFQLCRFSSQTSDCLLKNTSYISGRHNFTQSKRKMRGTGIDEYRRRGKTHFIVNERIFGLRVSGSWRRIGSHCWTKLKILQQLRIDNTFKIL